MPLEAMSTLPQKIMSPLAQRHMKPFAVRIEKKVSRERVERYRAMKEELERFIKTQVSTKFTVSIGAFSSDGVPKDIVVFAFANERETIRRLFDEKRSTLVHVKLENVPINIVAWEDCVDAVKPLERIEVDKSSF